MFLEYRAPDISYKKMSLDISEISSKKTRKCRNIPSNNDNERNVTVDDLLSLSFPLSEAVDLMEQVKHFTYCLHNQYANNL